MREELQQPHSDEDSDASRASADAARLHAVARRIQLREHASRQQQLQLHKQLQQQQQLLQQQQQQLHQQDALLRHQEQLLRQQEQQLASRETEAGLLLRQVGLLQQQLEERADRLAAAEGNYMDAAALLHQLQQRVNLGSAARLLVEEHLYAEVRRLKRQLSLRMRLPASPDEAEKDALSERDKEKGVDADSLQHKASFDASATSASANDQQQQQQKQQTASTAMSPDWRAAEAPGVGPIWCCAEAAEANACVAWGCSGCCCCSSESQHEAAVQALRVALHNCRCAMESREHREAAATSAAAAAAASGAAVLAVTEALHRCPAAGADAEIVDVLLERLRAESMQIRVYAQQRRAAAAASSSGSSVALQEAQQGGLATVEEPMEREAYDVMGTALPQEVLLPLLAVQNISTLLRLKQQSVLLANSRWLQLLRDTVGSKFLEGSSCSSTSSTSSSTISGALTDRKASSSASSQLAGAGDSSGVVSASVAEAASERRQHVLLQLLMRGDLPQLFGTLNLTSLPCELIYAQNKQAKSPADLLPSLTQPQLLQLHELQLAAAAGELQQQAELQQQIAAVSGNLRAWRSVASALYRQHNNIAALALYTEALKLQQRLLDKQQQLDGATGGNGASSLSLLENTAKLAFNKASYKSFCGRLEPQALPASKTLTETPFCLPLSLITMSSSLEGFEWLPHRNRSWSARSALRLGRMTPNYKAAYETAAEACEWLLDFEGALNYIQLMRQHCPEAFSADHYHKRRLYEAQLQASSFQVLGIDKGAPKAAVNRAFRRMSIVWHPDKASALSEDLRLRHENHFKRQVQEAATVPLCFPEPSRMHRCRKPICARQVLNEARIALLDPDSYARQLLVPVQTLYRHPELLVAPAPPQQANPSPTFLLQPEQLSSEQLQQEQQQQLQQHRREQPNDDQQPQEQEDQALSLEKLQQQRQQLLRSIGSLQRQQHELQRELEEHHAAVPPRASSASASNTLRWQELQKLQQQQQNKQKRLAECEREIGQRLRRQQQQQQPEEKQLDPETEAASSEWGRSEGAASNISSPGQTTPEQAWHHAPQQQQQQQPEQGESQPQEQEREAAHESAFSVDDSLRAGRVETSHSLLSSPRSSAVPSAAAATSAAASAATTAARAAATAAAEVIKEAAAAALSGQGKTGAASGFVDAPSPWHSIVSSDSDTEVPTVRSPLYPDEREFRSSSSSSSSSGTFPTTGTPHLSAGKGGSTSSQPGPSASQAAAQAGGAAAETPGGHSRASFRAFRSAARGGSRASSAGPQIRTGEAAATAAAAAAMATARRSLTTCICSAAPRRTTAPTEAGSHPQPSRANNTFWDETDSSSSNSSSDSSSDTNDSNDSGSSDGEERDLDRASEKRWATSTEYGRGGLAASTPGQSHGLAKAASIGSSSSRAAVTKPQQPVAPQPRLPVPPPRRLSAAARRHASGSGSSVESRGRGKGLTARRPFVRARDTQQRPQPNQQEQQQQQQQQQQHRQQLWPGTGSRREVSAQNVTGMQAEESPANVSVQHATASAWMRPPDFPEPFAPPTAVPRPPHEDLQEASARPLQQQKPQQQQQQQQQRSESLSGEGPGSVPVRKDVEGAEGGRQTSPPFFAPSSKLSHSFDYHRLRQRDFQQAQLLHQQSLQEEGREEAAKSARHQLLFPDEELILKNTRAAAAAAAAGVADTKATASMASASAAGSRPSSSRAPASEGPALSGPAWEASQGAGVAADVEGMRAIPADRRFRWPTSSDGVSGAFDAKSGSKAAAFAPPDVLPATARPALHTKTASGGEAACTPGAPIARATSGGSIGESCSSSRSEESSLSHRCSSNSSRSPSSGSASGAEEPPDENEDWREEASSYKQTQQQQQQQQQQRAHQQQPQPQERFYHSVAQETPHQLRSPPEADSIFLMQWGIGAPPQRSSVPLLGHSGSGGHTESASVHKDTFSMATPTRLFPQYGPSHLDMQQGSQPLRFAGPTSGVSLGGEGVSAAAVPAVGGRGGRPSGDLHGLGLGNDNEFGGPLNRQRRSEGQQGGDLSASLGAWQPVLTRASMPNSTEGALLHSPRTPKL
ncbi:hypothetical protein Emed_005061 [Eimeria media]